MSDIFQLTPPENIPPKQKRSPSPPVFKNNEQGQVEFFPPSLEEWIADDHPVRVINQVIAQLDISEVLQQYKGGGTSSYHPRVMIKAWVYGYFTGENTSRTLARALRENIHFMWLCGGQKPDFRTLNLFYGSRLKSKINLIFKELTLYFIKSGQINPKQAFTDGTIMQANGNRHKAIWRKQVERERTKLERKIAEKITEIENLNIKENQEYGDQDLLVTGEKNPGEIAETILRLNEQLKPPPPDPESPDQKKKSGKLEREKAKLVEKLKEYQKKTDQLDGRNSANKTDPEATYFRDKQGALVPAYNVQVSTSNQYVTHYSIHQKAADTSCLTDHLSSMPEAIRKHLKTLVADAGYGSEQNYEIMEQMGITAYVKYNLFHQDLKTGEVRFPVNEGMIWNLKEKTWQCSCKSLMKVTRIEDKVTAQGFTTYLHRYVCPDCGTQVSTNHKLYRLKSNAFDRLTSPMGVYLRKQRNVEVETVFGDLKQNMGHRRLKSRGKSLVNVELGLAFAAHNFKKYIKQLGNNPEMNKNLAFFVAKSFCVKLFQPVSLQFTFKNVA